MEVIKAVQQQFALVLRQPHVLQPVPHGLVQQPACSTCWQWKALQQRETFQPVAAALWGRDVALPHNSWPAEPSAQAARGWRRQRPTRRGCHPPPGSGGRTTVSQDGLKWVKGKIKIVRSPSRQTQGSQLWFCWEQLKIFLKRNPEAPDFLWVYKLSECKSSDGVFASRKWKVAS